MALAVVMCGYFIGLDLGKARDYSALAVVQRVTDSPASYHLRHLERVRLGTSYTEVVDRVGWLVSTPELWDTSTLVVDATGVGAAVCDLLHRCGIPSVSVTIAGGTTPAGSSDSLRVPKRDLITTLVRLCETKRLKMSADVPLTWELIKELKNFKVRINPRTRRESYQARGSKSHDDILMSCSLAAWYAERMSDMIQTESK